MKQSGYTKPQIKTLEGADVVEALGPVSAGSGKISLDPVGSDFRPNTNTCGTPMGYPCP